MGLLDYGTHGRVARVILNDNENRFNPDFLNAFLDVLDEIESQTETTTLVVTSAHEKIFCNGIDLEWLVPVIQQQDQGVAKRFFYQLNRLFKRLITYPLVTIAAISGHAFAGGAILCCAFDFRFMRLDRGFFCLPEVDLGIPFLPGMNALLRSVIPEQMLRRMELTGIRLTAETCRDLQIIEQACPIEELMDTAMAFAGQIDKKRSIVSEMKRRLNRDILHAIEVEDVAYIESGRFNIA